MAKLTKHQVKHVAKLANLTLSSEEEEKYSEQISKILDYVDQLNSADTKNVEPTFNVSGKSNVLEEDRIGECLSSEDILSNAPKKQDNFFVTKGVFDNE